MSSLVPDEWIVGYAAGTLNEGQSLIVASHLSYHDALQERMHDAEAIGGAMLHNMDKADVSPATRDAVLAQLDEIEPESVPEVSHRRVGDVPLVLADYLQTDLDQLDWRFLGPGMKHARIWTGMGAERVWMFKGDAGRVVAEHGHTGDEMTLVLTGGFSAQGTAFQPGDMETADLETVHQPIIDADGECICLVYTEAPMRPKNPLVRLVQPLIGI